MGKEYSIGFQTLNDELSLESLPIEGNIPDWLSGTLIRNGPAKFEFGDRRYNTWLDGMAMLNRFSIHDGKVSFSNKYLDSKTFKKNRKTDSISVAEFATDPCRTIFQRVYSVFFPDFTDNASVNIAKIANKFVAMTETSVPIEFDPETIESLSHLNFSGSVKGELTTAHPQYDFDRDETYNYTTDMSVISHYKVFKLSGNSNKRELIASVPALKPSYMHSFAMTENYIVLAEFPLKVCPSQLLLGFSLLDRPFIDNFKWLPEGGTQFQVIDKRDGNVVAKLKAPPFYAFHHINAFERGEEIVLDIAAFDDASVISELYLDRLCGDQPDALSFSQFRRYTLPLDGSETSFEVLSDEAIELPRINYRHFNGKPYSFAYGISFIKDSPGDWYNQLVKVNVEEKVSSVWNAENCYPGEPVFVPAPEASSEDDGVILSVVLDAKKRSSYLLVLDAKTFTEMGRAIVPLAMPFGFHGQFLSLLDSNN